MQERTPLPEPTQNYTPTKNVSSTPTPERSWQDSNYQNPTATTQSTKEFGEGTSQFNIDPFVQPFNFQQQQQQSGDFRDRFTGFLEGQETPEATRQRFENRYGYQPLREEYLRSGEMLGDLSSSIRAKPEQVLGRSRNTLMTSSQAGQITEKEVGDLMKIYQGVGQINEQQGKRLAMVEQNMNQAAQLEMANQQRMSQPWLMEYDTQAIVQAREFSGWTFANQIELDRIKSNRDAGLGWRVGEEQRAQQLAIAEMGFANELEKIRLSGEQSRLTKKAPTDLSTLWRSFA